MESSLTFLGRLGHYAHDSHKILRRKYEKKVSRNFAIVSLLSKNYLSMWKKESLFIDGENY